LRADLIVLGARHPEPAKINSHLPWATAARVIAEAECPVLTVRQKEA
jgi:nucleotide-binding universal stress UspA family protein